MAYTRKNKDKDDDDPEFVLPEPDTSSDSEEYDTDDEEGSLATTYPVLTQGTSAAVNGLLGFQTYLVEPPDSTAAPMRMTGESPHEEAAEPHQIGQEPEEEVQTLLVRQCDPFQPHPHLLSQMKFEATPCPPRNAAASSNLESQIVAPEPGPQLPLTTAAAIADALVADNNESLDFDDDELELLCTAANVGKRTKKTEAKIANLIKRWFTTIKDHGGDILSSLLVVVASDSTGGRTNDYAFFNILGGEKTYEKTIILNKCCILCGMKWLCLTGKNKGTPLAPISFTKYMSTVFNEFRCKNGLLYDFRNDFNDKGQFHGVMIVNWNKIRQKDPKFGTKQHQAQFDWEADSKIREAIKDGRLKPYHDAIHLQLVTLYILGRMFLLRGCKEMSSLNHHDTYGGVYGRDMGELAGNEYEAIHVPESKTNPLNLDNPEALSKEDQAIEIAENPFDVICAVKLLRFYKDHCHPNAVKFFAKVASHKDKIQYKVDFPNKKDIWYKPAAIGLTQNNVGHNKIAGFMKTLGQIIGVDNIDKFTNHALRGYAITKMHVARVPLTMRMKFARHSCEKSQIPYARLTNDGFIQAQLALRGVNGTADMVVAETNSAIQKSNNRKRQAATQPPAPPSLNDVIPSNKGTTQVPGFEPLESIGNTSNVGKLQELSKEDLMVLLIKSQQGPLPLEIKEMIVPSCSTSGAVGSSMVAVGMNPNRRIGFQEQHDAFPTQQHRFPTNSNTGFPADLHGGHQHHEEVIRQRQEENFRLRMQLEHEANLRLRMELQNLRQGQMDPQGPMGQMDRQRQMDRQLQMEDHRQHQMDRQRQMEMSRGARYHMQGRPSPHWYNGNDTWEFNYGPGSRNQPMQVTRRDSRQQSVFSHEDIGGNFNGRNDASFDGSFMSGSSNHSASLDGIGRSSRNGSFDGSFGSGTSSRNGTSFGSNGPYGYFEGSSGRGSW